MKPEVGLLFTFFRGGRAAPTELPLEEDRDAGILDTGFGTGLGVGFTGAGGTLFTVDTDVELFRELLELRSDALDVDLSTLKELARFGIRFVRFGSMGVRGGVLVSLVAIFFGCPNLGTGDLEIFGTGDSHSTLQPEEAPWDALSEFRLWVSSNPSSFNSCSLLTFDILGEVVLSGTFSGAFSVRVLRDFLYPSLDQTPVGWSAGDLSSLIAFCTSSWFIEVCRLIRRYGFVSLVVLSVLWLFNLSCHRFNLVSFSSLLASIGFATSCGASTLYDA